MCEAERHGREGVRVDSWLPGSQEVDEGRWEGYGWEVGEREERGGKRREKRG